MALSKIKAPSIADDSITVDQIADNAVYGRRNMLINGNYKIAQRGTSVTGKTSGGYYTCDRWQTDITGAGTWSLSQSTEAPDGFTKSLKWDCTTADASLAAADYIIHQQRIEAQNLQHLQYGTSSAKQVTLSFWVRSSKTGTYWAEIYHADATYFIAKKYSIDAADTWEYKTLTFDGYQTTAVNDDTGIGFYINWWLAAGSNRSGGTEVEGTWHTTEANRVVGQVNLADSTSNDWYITGCQLEVGNKATPFEHRSFGEELSLCQRYYNKPNMAASLHPFLLQDGQNYRIAFFDFPCTMRAAPTATITATAAGASFNGTPSAGTGLDNAYARADLDGNGYASITALTFDAEL